MVCLWSQYSEDRGSGSLTEASLVYRMRSRTFRATEKPRVKKKQKEKENNQSKN